MRLLSGLFGRVRRCLLQPEGVWILHAGYFPAIRPGAGELCHADSRVSGVGYGGADAVYVLISEPRKIHTDHAVPLGAGVTVYSALRKSSAQAGDWVVLLGAGGGLGHLACQIASKGMGLRVIGIDAGNKKDLATECGAEVFIDHTQGKAEEEVKKATGGLGAQAVLVLTAANGAYARCVCSVSRLRTVLTLQQRYGPPEVRWHTRLCRTTRRRAQGYRNRIPVRTSLCTDGAHTDLTLGNSSLPRHRRSSAWL